jgi:ABC-type Fe3+ transport system permease subunit
MFCWIEHSPNRWRRTGSGIRSFSDRGSKWFVVGALILYLGLLLSPLVALLLAGHLSPAGSWGESWWGLVSSPRWRGIFSRTLLVAFGSATLATLGGWLAAGCLDRLPPRTVRWWSLALAATVLISPYVFVQGWIGWLGDQGRWWRWFGGSRPGFSLYSANGVILMLALAHLPLSALVIHTLTRLFPARYQEASRLFQFGWKQQWRWVIWPQRQRGLALSFLWIFVLAFWSFDVPSMLRQNLYALEIVAAFGSFYDYARAGLLCLPPAIMVSFLALISLPLTAGLDLNARRWHAISESDSRRHLAPVALLLVLVLVLIVPLAGLVAQIDGPREFIRTWQMFQRDAWNSLRNGLLTAGLSMSVCFLIAAALRWQGSTTWTRFLTVSQLALISLPGAITGMGFVYLLNFPGNGWISATGLQLLLVEFVIVVPTVMLLMLGLHHLIPRAWIETQSLLRIGFWRASREISLPLLWPSLAAIFGLAFALSIREVPASLLNYPPNGSTLALTIETLLHFDQPGRVASLCLTQFALAGLATIPFLWRCGHD